MSSALACRMESITNADMRQILTLGINQRFVLTVGSF